MTPAPTRSYGIQLAALNLILAIVCAGSFLGILHWVSAHNRGILEMGAGASETMPFPYLYLLAAYAIAFPSAWLWFSRRLPATVESRKAIAVLGASSLFFISFIGAAFAITGAFCFSKDIEPGTFFVTLLLSMLVAAAGIVCVVIVGFAPEGTGRKSPSYPPKSSAAADLLSS